MIVYKLTDAEDFTYHKSCKWGPGVTHETSGEGDLCSPGWLHHYTDPIIALLLNPIHGDYRPLKLWLARAEGAFKHDSWLKSGCTRLTTIELLELPPITTEHRVSFAIRCAQTVCLDNKNWLKWADRWLNNTDRTRDAAYYAASDAARNAAYAASHAACAASDAARNAAYAASHAADAAYDAANAASYAAYAARNAAYAARKSDPQPILEATFVGPEWKRYLCSTTS